MLQGPTSVVTAAAEEYPRPFGAFELLKSLGPSARGEEFIALRNEGVERFCVVTVLDPGLASDTVVRALRAEAAWLVRRMHGSIVQVYDVGQADEDLFFVSELVEGRDLRAFLDAVRGRRMNCPPEVALQLAIDAADAFEFVREHEGKATGVATSFLGTSSRSLIVGVEGRGKLVHQGSCVALTLDMLERAEPGRASLVAPELVAGAPSGPRSDVFAVGALLWEALTQRSLATDAAAHLRALKQGTWHAPSLGDAAARPSGRDLPAELVAVLSAALSADPTQRPADIASFRAELVSSLKRLGGGAHETTRRLMHDLFGRELADEATELTRLTAALGLDAAASVSREDARAPGARRSSSVTLTNFDARRKRTPLKVVGDLVLGKVIPGTRYRALSKLGEGGMGAVYAAEHVDIEKKVALKLLHADFLQNPVVLQQFRQEARAASRIGNPNICDVTDWGEVADGRVFFVMEYLDGPSLSKVIKKSRRLKPEECIPILRQVCKALGAAHEKGIVHLDVKPDNVSLIEKDGRRNVVKVLDFGIAGLLGQGGPGSKVMGTPEYMAPERTQGMGYDHRSDIYSLGIVAYEMLVGEVPFQGATPVETLAMQAMDPPDAISERLTSPVPAALEAVVMKMLAKDPARRPQTMAEVEALLCEAQIDARLRTPWDDLPVPPVEPERARWIARRMRGTGRTVLLVGGLGAIAVAAVVFALVVLVRDGREPEARPPSASLRAPAAEPGKTFGIAAEGVKRTPGAGAEAELVPAPAATTGTGAAPGGVREAASGARAEAAPAVAAAGAQPHRRRVTEEAAEAEPGREREATTPREGAGTGREGASKVRALIEQAQAAFASGLVKQAEKEYAAAESLEPRHPDVLGGLAEVAFEQADYARAIKYASDAVKAAGRRPRGKHLLVLGDAYFKRNRYTEALDAYTRAKALVPPAEVGWRIERVNARLAAH